MTSSIAESTNACLEAERPIPPMRLCNSTDLRRRLFFAIGESWYVENSESVSTFSS